MEAKPTKITKYWRISRILEEFPDSVEVFMEYDLDCVGCSASSTERLIDGLKSHDYSDQTIDEIMQRLNQIADLQFQESLKDQSKLLKELKIQETDDSFLIGDFEIHKSAFNAIIQSNKDKKIFEIKLQASGCSGFEYQLNFVENANQSNQIFEIQDLKISLDYYTYEKSKGAKLYFKQDLIDSGLRIENPNQKTKCQCGKSIGF